ncbi:hypothetical protein PsYK624_151360 [Phanerochaete sordida]|uniref:Uncharacterized protein n=1 Tax=Phanerochaete sordida TaxID=48140 RepID=A0A9P3GNT6_9APHY|nr:hypothetical protein PsYK624_151360 [Phanerochaete sordida]
MTKPIALLVCLLVSAALGATLPAADQVDGALLVQPQTDPSTAFGRAAPFRLCADGRREYAQQPVRERRGQDGPAY